MEAVGGRMGASGRIDLTGNEMNGKPCMIVTPNAFGDTPLIKRVEGLVKATFEAHVDAWIATLSKEWEWELIKFDHPFGTEPAFSLIPMTIRETRRSLTNAPPAAVGRPGPVRRRGRARGRGAAVRRRQRRGRHGAAPAEARRRRRLR
jgi:hypothetical protein